MADPDVSQLLLIEFGQVLPRAGAFEHQGNACDYLAPQSCWQGGLIRVGSNGGKTFHGALPFRRQAESLSGKTIFTLAKVAKQIQAS
ncbi:hypothetical protein D3C80_2059070 [compost metagenome]